MASNIANTEIPNQMNLQKTANSFDSNRQSIGMVTNALTAFVNNLKKYNAAVDKLDINKTSKTFLSALNMYVDTVKKLQDVEIKALKKMPSKKSFDNITSTFKSIMEAMKQGFADMAASLGKDSTYDNLLKLLTPQKEVKEEKKTNDLGVGIVETTTTESGNIMDCLNLILNVYGQLGNMEKTGPLKGLIKGKMIVKRFKNQVLDTFINIFDLCINEFAKYDAAKVQNIYEAVKSVDKITVVLCQLLQKLSEPAVIIGSQKRVLLKGFNLLIGSPEEGETAEGGGIIGWGQKIVGKRSKTKKTRHNLMGVISTVFDTLVTLNEKYGRNAQKAFRNINDLTESLIKITTSFALLGLLAIPAIIGMKVLVGFGKNGNFGIISGLIRIMNRLAEAKDAQTASKNMLLISGAVMLLSGAVALMALTGAMIITNWANVFITLGISLALITLVGLLGSKVFKKNIEAGTKSLLMLSGAILLLSLTAVALVATGQFLIASWDSIGQTALLIAVLAGAMWLLSFMKNTFEQSAKSMLILTMTVGLLGLISVGLVWISNYIGGNWGSVFLIFIMMAALAGTMWLVGQIGNQVDVGGVLVVTIGSLLLSFTMLVLTKAAKNLDTWGGAGAFLLIVISMIGIILAVGGLFIALGGISANPVFWLGVAAMGVIVAAVLSFTSLINAIANAQKTMAETAKMVKDEDWGKNSDGTEKSMSDYLMKPIDAMIEVAQKMNGQDVSKDTKKKFKRLSKIAGYISNMALTLKDIASLNMPIYNNGKIVGYRQMTAADFQTAATNAGAIAKTLIGMFSAETQVTVGNRTIKVGLLHDLDNDAAIMPRHRRRMKRLAKITSFIGNMAKTLQDIATMRYPDEFDKDGKPISWKPMDNTMFGKAAENAKTIATTLVGMFSEKDFRKTLKKIDEDAAETLGIVLNSVGNLSDVLGVIGTLASGEIPSKTEERNGKLVVLDSIPLEKINIDIVSANIKNLLTIVIQSVASLDKKTVKNAKRRIKNVDTVVKTTIECLNSVIDLYQNSLKDIDTDKMSEKYKGAGNTLTSIVSLFAGKTFTNANATAFNKQTESLVKVLKQVDGTDINKLKYAYSLVSKLADFAKSIRGDFDKLAECISEDLIEAIEKLNETFEGTSKNLNISTTSTADFTPNKSGTDAETKSSSTDNKNITAMQAQIDALQRELDEYKQQMKMPRIKTDPSTGAVVVKMLN